MNRSETGLKSYEFDKSISPYKAVCASLPHNRRAPEKTWGLVNADRYLVRQNGFYVSDGVDHHINALVASNGGKLGFGRALREGPQDYKDITLAVADQILEAGFYYTLERMKARVDSLDPKEAEKMRAMDVAAAIMVGVYYVDGGQLYTRLGQLGDVRYDQTDRDGKQWHSTDQSFIEYVYNLGNLTDEQFKTLNWLVEEHILKKGNAVISPDGYPIIPKSGAKIRKLLDDGAISADIYVNNRSFLDTSISDPRLKEIARPDYAPIMTKFSVPAGNMKAAVVSTDGLGDAVARSTYMKELTDGSDAHDIMNRLLQKALLSDHDDDVTLVVLEPVR